MHDTRLSRWSWSVRRGEAHRRARRRTIAASRVGSATLLVLGIAMPLPLVYQLTIGDHQARHEASETRLALEQSWHHQTTLASPRAGGSGPPKPGTVLSQQAAEAPAPRYPVKLDYGKPFAVLHLAAIRLDTPIAEGVDKTAVLDRGLVGHYSGDQETALPWQAAGNFAIAAHRNTHGEPFRRLNQIKAGDAAVVETAYEYYVYRITGGIDEVSPDDVSVLKPIPAGSGFTVPGRYITLTTCTPDFSSRGRLIRFGVLVRVVLRSSQPAGVPGL